MMRARGMSGLAVAMAAVGVVGAAVWMGRSEPVARPAAPDYLHAGHAGSDAEAHDYPAEDVAEAMPALVAGTTPPPGPAPPGMVWIPGGTFWMGCAGCGMPDAEPVHLVTVDGFWMDETPVTNAAFERFVRATGYVTVAERPLDPRDFPGVPAASLVPGSVVFTPPAAVHSLANPGQWWRYVAGASWQHPEGPDSSIRGREQHPVVHVAWEDAMAYLRWTGKQLPTEAQFEFAARGGLDRQPYAWGGELRPGGTPAANIWQGSFPVSNTAEDGYRGTSPVTAFPPNGFGLRDMGGNVWQWCADWYRPDTYRHVPSEGRRNPAGPADSFDPAEPGIPKRVQRGGSFLCSEEYCIRYLVGSRGKGAADTGSSNVGFRGVHTG
jgi:formylglycine-generating enzyme